jgi:hypothetical protein
MRERRSRAPSAHLKRDLDLLTALRRLWSHKIVVSLALVIAVALASLTRYTVTSSGVTLKQTSTSTSAAQVLVDTRFSSLAQASLPTSASTITSRTPLYADLAASLPVRRAIARNDGVPAGSIDVTAETTETSSPAGAATSTSYNAAPSPHAADRIVLSASDAVPILGISATADSAGRAASLVNATVTTLQRSVTALERSEHIRGPNRMLLRSLGSAQGTTTVSTTSLVKTILVGVVVLILLLLLILALDGVLRYRRQARFAESPA